MSGVIENGVIKRASIEIEDHGILVIIIDIRFDGTEQGYLVSLGKENAYVAIRSILEAVEVGWEKLNGTSCRVKRTKEFGFIERIGHIYKDKWSKRF